MRTAARMYSEIAKEFPDEIIHGDGERAARYARGMQCDAILERCLVTNGNGDRRPLS